MEKRVRVGKANMDLLLVTPLGLLPQVGAGPCVLFFSAGVSVQNCHLLAGCFLFCFFFSSTLPKEQEIFSASFYKHSKNEQTRPFKKGLYCYRKGN